MRKSLAPACAAFALFATGSPLLADAPPPPDTDQYHYQAIKMGGKTTYIRVQKSGGSFKNTAAPSDGKYDPSQLDFSKQSSFANQSFSTGADSSKRTASSVDLRAFPTHAFGDSTTDAGRSLPNLHSRYPTTTAEMLARSDDTFHKTFATSATNLDTAAPFDTDKRSEFQGKTALLGDAKTPTFANAAYSNKTFNDPELQHVRQDPYAATLDASRVANLPNRALSIDEVRELINHETLPDTSQEAPTPSKALNDPSYVPQAEPAVPEASQTPAASTHPSGKLDDANGDLPSPGMMAAQATSTENSEPLPK